jgi:hypothetical protein
VCAGDGCAREDVIAMAEQIQVEFDPAVSMTDAEGTLRLAQLAAESLHGTARVELEACCDADRSARRVSIDTSTDVGRTLALVFLGYARCEFGADALRVHRHSPRAVEVRH